MAERLLQTIAGFNASLSEIFRLQLLRERRSLPAPDDRIYFTSTFSILVVAFPQTSITFTKTVFPELGILTPALSRIPKNCDTFRPLHILTLLRSWDNFLPSTILVITGFFWRIPCLLLPRNRWIRPNCMNS